MNEGYTKVFVSLDGTEQQDFVLARAIKVAANNGAKLIIGHVIDSTALESAGSYPVDLVNGLEEAFKNSIAKQLEEAKANPDIPEVEVMIRAGRIRETLKDEMLDVVKPDLVLCGARGLSSIKYALLGSISTFLLRNTDCDILVVKIANVRLTHRGAQARVPKSSKSGATITVAPLCFRLRIAPEPSFSQRSPSEFSERPYPNLRLQRQVLQAGQTPLQPLPPRCS